MPQPLRNISLYSGFLAPPNQSYPLALDTLLRWIPFSVSHLDLLLCGVTEHPIGPHPRDQPIHLHRLPGPSPTQR